MSKSCFKHRKHHLLLELTCVLKDIDRYKKKNSIVAEVAIKKFLGHIWYLSEELLAFAFIDDRVSIDTNYQVPNGCCSGQNWHQTSTKENNIGACTCQLEEIGRFCLGNIRILDSSAIQAFHKVSFSKMLILGQRTSSASLPRPLS